MPDVSVPRISVVVPFLNEEDNLRPLVMELRKALKGISHELILVDDGSTDRSLSVARGLEDDRTLVIVLAARHGQSYAIKAGLDRCTGLFIAKLDADGQNLPSDLVPMLWLLEGEEGKGSDMVQGYRGERHDNVIKRLPSLCANAVIRWVLHVPVKDTGCSTRVFRRSVLESLLYFDGFHRYIPVIAVMKGHSLQQIRVGHAPRVKGVSKYGLGRIPKVLWQVALLRFSPCHLETGLPYRTRTPEV